MIGAFTHHHHQGLLLRVWSPEFTEFLRESYVFIVEWEVFPTPWKVCFCNVDNGVLGVFFYLSQLRCPNPERVCPRPLQQSESNLGRTFRLTNPRAICRTPNMLPHVSTTGNTRRHYVYVSLHKTKPGVCETCSQLSAPAARGGTSWKSPMPCARTTLAR